MRAQSTPMPSSPISCIFAFLRGIKSGKKLDYLEQCCDPTLCLFAAEWNRTGYTALQGEPCTHD